MKSLSFVLAVALSGCRRTEQDTVVLPRVEFTRCGVVLRGIGPEGVGITSGGAAVQFESTSTNRGSLLEFPVTPGGEYEVSRQTANGRRLLLRARAPMNPAPLCVQRFELEDVASATDYMGMPDTCMAFNPDGTMLAVGSFGGHLRAYSVHHGELLHDRTIPEGMVKCVGWSTDGRTLYAAEQSPDGFVYAFSMPGAKELWRFRLADDLETSSMPANASRYAAYELPAAYGMKVVSDGSLLVAAMHSWHKSGKPVNLGRVYRLDSRTGKPIWRFPPERPLNLNVIWMDASADGRFVAVSMSRSFGTAGDEDYSSQSVLLLNGDDGSVLSSFGLPPLRPHFDEASAWQSFSISQDGSLLACGYRDGRSVLLPLPPGPNWAPLWVKNEGAPIVVSDIPVAASMAYSCISPGAVYFSSRATEVAPGGRREAGQIALSHPNANSIFAYDVKGNPLWKWRAKGEMQGIVADRSGRWLAATVAQDYGIQNLEGFGLLVFDAQRAGSGLAKYVYHYETSGPAFFRPAMTADGSLIAVAETPLVVRSGDSRRILGSYCIHVLQ